MMPLTVSVSTAHKKLSIVRGVLMVLSHFVHFTGILIRAFHVCFKETPTSPSYGHIKIIYTNSLHI